MKWKDECQANKKIPVFRLTQWLDAWDDYEFDPHVQRRKPEPYIYLFSMPATTLRRLSDVYRRERDVQSAEGLQREREESRTARIRRYIVAGYPFGDLRPPLRSRNKHLRKPGWLPTAIVVNILTPSDRRRGKAIKKPHTARLIEREDKHQLQLPVGDDFSPTDLRPFEVIDGQHRLWSFDGDDDASNFEVPVVAFRGLDVAWQAYLFWSINISPKRINPSHAFDLYPLLRTQDWLETKGEITVYREARAQEITEWLYRFPASPWHDRINMLQRKGKGNVSQASWVLSLIGSFFGTGRGKGRHGLFQSPYGPNRTTLRWERVQQIAFVLDFWVLLKEGIDESEHDWIELYRSEDKDGLTDKSSLLNQGMGVRAAHAVLNDIFFSRAEEWDLNSWDFGVEDKTLAMERDIEGAISSLRKTNFHCHLLQTTDAMAGFDWRSVDGPRVRGSEQEMTTRAYRGSGGITVLMHNILTYVAQHGESAVAAAANELLPEQ